MSYKTITLRVTPEIEAYVDWLHTQFSCSKQEAIRRCVIYCVGCPEKVNNYMFSRAQFLSSTSEVQK